MASSKRVIVIILLLLSVALFIGISCLMVVLMQDTQKWGAWTAWSSCSSHCHFRSGQKQDRVRTCYWQNKPAKNGYEKECSALEGASEQVRDCPMDGCFMDGVWGLWSAWSDCSTPSGPGNHTQTRSCDSPSPRYGGQPCEGETEKTKECEDSVWSTWSPYRTGCCIRDRTCLIKSAGRVGCPGNNTAAVEHMEEQDMPPEGCIKDPNDDECLVQCSFLGHNYRFTLETVQYYLPLQHTPQYCQKSCQESPDCKSFSSEVILGARQADDDDTFYCHHHKFELSELYAASNDSETAINIIVKKKLAYMGPKWCVNQG